MACPWNCWMCWMKAEIPRDWCGSGPWSMNGAIITGPAMCGWSGKSQTAAMRVLLQKRSSRKDSFAGCYDISSAGHIPAGDGYLQSARRELKEELGITASEEELEFAGFFESQYEGDFYGKPFINREKAAVYVYRRPVEAERLELQADEVESVRWMDLEKACQAAKTQADGFCLQEGELLLLKKALGAYRKIRRDIRAGGRLGGRRSDGTICTHSVLCKKMCLL